VSSDLTYRVGGGKNTASIPDGLDVFGYVLDLVSGVDVPEIVVELLFGLLDFL
jgi:hypothetical protein